MTISELAAKLVGDKRRWRAYKTRIAALPEPYRIAVEGVERYLMHFGLLESNSAASLFEDVADLFERAAADGVPVRTLVGDDPVDFVETLIRNYDRGGYIARERQRLVATIERAVAAGITD